MHSQSVERALDGFHADTVYRLLSHPRRRSLLVWLDDRDGSPTLGDAAEALAASEAEHPPAEIPAKEVERVYMTLYHTHVPKLADEAFITYDPDRETVDLTERGERLREVVELVPEMTFLSDAPAASAPKSDTTS